MIKKDFFENCVKNEFVFLESDYSFNRVIENNGIIRYINNILEIVVNYDGRITYELDLNFDLVDKNRMFGLHSLLELKKDKDVEFYKKCFAADTEEELSNLIAKVAGKLREYINDLLSNDNVFNELLQFTVDRDKKFNEALKKKKQKRIIGDLIGEMRPARLTF